MRAGLALAGLVGIAPFLTGCSESEAIVAENTVRPVKLIQVERSNQGEMHSFPARVFASEESRISFRIPGELMSLPVAPAQEVKKGELLARLDDRDLKNQVELRQADFGSDASELHSHQVTE